MNNLMTTFSATDLKNNAADILNIVYYRRSPVVIEKFGKPVAKFIPFVKDSFEKESEDDWQAKYLREFSEREINNFIKDDKLDKKTVKKFKKYLS